MFLGRHKTLLGSHLLFICAAGDTTNLDRCTAVWMENVVEALEAAGCHLKHVYFTQG